MIPARTVAAAVIALAALLAASPALAHAVSGGDAAFMEAAVGAAPVPYLYLGAKHMVTGYDHLLFLTGVVFFLHRLRDVAVIVTLFSLGHSITLLAGVLGGFHVDPFLVDAVIGLSVVWKAFDNLGGFATLFGVRIDPRPLVFGFGLVHGLGLAAKLQDVRLPADGLIANMLAFNLGVEAGQILALAVILVAMNAWRRTRSFARLAGWTNVLLMAAGFFLVAVQLSGWLGEGA